MKITPLEIRQKAFDTHFRGYDKEEVDAFLLSLSQEWERVNNNVRESEIRLESTDKELEKLREVESSLFKTLKTAEDTSQSVIAQANKSAELQLRETQMNTEALLNDARVLARDMIDEAEAAIRNSYDVMKEQFKDLQQDYQSLETHRDNLLSEMKNFTTSMQEKIERSEKQKYTFKMDFDSKGPINVNDALEPLDKAYEEISKFKDISDFSRKAEKGTEVVWDVTPIKEQPIIEKVVPINEIKEVKPEDSIEDKSEGDSFFDM